MILLHWTLLGEACWCWRGETYIISNVHHLDRRKEACLQKEALIKEHLGIMQAGLAALNEYESNQ